MLINSLVTKHAEHFYLEVINLFKLLSCSLLRVSHFLIKQYSDERASTIRFKNQHLTSVGLMELEWKEMLTFLKQWDSSNILTSTNTMPICFIRLDKLFVKIPINFNKMAPDVPQSEELLLRGWKGWGFRTLVGRCLLYLFR